MRPRTLALGMIGAALVLSSLGYCVGRHAADPTIAAAEERAATAAGALTAERMSRTDSAAVEAELRAELARVRAAVPTATVREVVRWRTGPVEVRTVTVPGETVEVPVPVPQPAGCVECLLPVGGSLDVRVTEARVASEAGAEGLVGRAEVWRTDPPPETRLLSAELRAALSSWRAVEGGAVDRPRLSRWAASAEAGISIDGPVYAGAVERRVRGPVWAGIAAGSVSRVGYVAGRVRVEW